MRTAKASMMQRKMVSSLLLIVTIALTGPVVAADDPYMQGIQEEASKLEQLGQAKKEYERLEKQQAGQQVAPGQKKVAPAPSTAPLSPAEVAAFENGLKQYPAGYGLYMQLDAKGQQAVFREYAQTADPPGARYLAAIRLIIKLAVGKP